MCIRDSYKGNERIDEVTPKYALLSTHAGRRTFICNALALGSPRLLYTSFRLYYTSASTDQQTIDIYIIDSFGQTQQLTLSFNNDNSEEGTESITPY